MSAEQYGARLLSEVEELSLEENITDVTKLLQDLRARVEPSPTRLLGLQALDELLELFRHHQTSTASIRGTLQAQHDTSRYSDDEPEAQWIDSAVNAGTSRRLTTRPPIVEMASPLSAAGKTSLLYLLTALALLSRDHGGKASAVVWLDTVGQFSATRLARIMTNIISKHDSNTTPSTTTIVHQALTHLHILQPNSSSQLLTTLQNLPSYLLSPASHSSTTRPLGLLILSSATAFHHQDRFTSEIARLNAGSTSHAASTPSLTAQIQSALLSLHARFSCTILFTTTSDPPTRTTRPATTPSNIPPDEQSSISTWTAFATLSLTTSRIAVPPFAPNMSLEQCLRDREKRQEAVAKGQFVISVDWKGTERWDAGVRQKVGELEGKGRCGMRVWEGGVEGDGM